MAVVLDGATGVDITAGSLIYPDDTSSTTRPTFEVIASDGSTTGMNVGSIEVTGLNDYQYVVGYLMAATTASEERLHLQFSVDSGSYITLDTSGNPAGASDTYASSFTMAPKPASGYVSMQGVASETTNTWSTTAGEIMTHDQPDSQMSYPATTGITGIKWLVTGGNMNYYRYVVMGIK